MADADPLAGTRTNGQADPRAPLDVLDALDAAATGPELDCEPVLQALANERRRRVIRLLADAGVGTELDKGTLSERIAALETGECPPAAQARRRVYTSLHQNHGPTLADAGLCESVDRDSALRCTESTQTAWLALRALTAVLGGDRA
jgi:hypothetical protein